MSKNAQNASKCKYLFDYFWSLFCHLMKTIFDSSSHKIYIHPLVKSKTEKKMFDII